MGVVLTVEVVVVVVVAAVVKRRSDKQFGFVLLSAIFQNNHRWSCAAARQQVPVD